LNSEIFEIKDWVIRVHLPEDKGPHPVLVLLHGWTGDENVMWVFASKLPPGYLMIAPRGLYLATAGGYSWHSKIERRWPLLEDFIPAVDGLEDLLTSESPGSLWDSITSHSATPDTLPDLTKVSLLGFSQGAALAYSYSLIHPERVRCLGGLSGFLPENSERFIAPNLFQKTPVFIAHGTRDELVPVEKARLSVQSLERAGAIVQYCEEDVGHKLSASCFRAMEKFFYQYLHK
jgi:phospholipase/carboxylesterase